MSQLLETAKEQFGAGNSRDAICSFRRVKASAKRQVIEAHALFEFGFELETAVSLTELAAELAGFARSYLVVSRSLPTISHSSRNPFVEGPAQC